MLSLPFSITDLDRATMGTSLAVHIVLAVIGIGLPLTILIAEYIGIKKNDPHYRILAKRLTMSLLIFFAVGTASGTLVALELLFLWPKFFALVAQVAILPVYVEVFAFFGEAIFLAIYVYGREKIKWKYAGVALMAIVGIFAALSGVLITMLNAFMNSPVGFNIPQYLSTGIITDVNPLAVFASQYAWIEIVHVIVTSYFASTFLFAGYFAYRFLFSAKTEERKQYYRKALYLTLVLAGIFTFISAVTGVVSIDSLYALQPEKYAAIENNLYTQAHAPEILLDYVASNGSLVTLLQIPDLQSILATGNASGVVPGLNQFPQWTWPPLFIHDLFLIMVFGAFLTGLFVLYLMYKVIMRKSIFARKTMWLTVFFGMLSVVILECGWVMAEIGRQPWIIYNVMQVSQAANQSHAIVPIAIGMLAFYFAILPLTIIVLKKIFRDRPLETELEEGDYNDQYGL